MRKSKDKEAPKEKKMTYVITDRCVTCGVCADACEKHAIDYGDCHYEIDQEKCVQCGTCDWYCPLGAIIQVDADSLKEEYDGTRW